MFYDRLLCCLPGWLADCMVFGLSMATSICRRATAVDQTKAPFDLSLSHSLSLFLSALALILSATAACNFLRILTLHCQCNWQALAACRLPLEMAMVMSLPMAMEMQAAMQRDVVISCNNYLNAAIIFMQTGGQFTGPASQPDGQPASHPSASGYFHNFIFIIMSPTIIIITPLTLMLVLQNNINKKHIHTRIKYQHSWHIKIPTGWR